MLGEPLTSWAPAPDARPQLSDALYQMLTLADRGELKKLTEIQVPRGTSLTTDEESSFWWLWWSQWRVSSIDTGTWALGLQLVALFGGGGSASLASRSLSMGGLVLRAHRHSLSQSCAVKMCALSFLLLLFPMLAVMTLCHHGLLNLRNDRGK